MEILIGGVLVILVLALAGVDIWYIMLGFMVMIATAAGIVAGFFLVCAVILLGSAGKTGRFARFQAGRRFDAAVYLVDGREFRNVFPAEFVLREKLYREDTDVRLRIIRGGRAFDRNAFITVVLGLPVSIAIAGAFGWGAVMLLGGI